MGRRHPSVLVLYNFVGEDEYERLKDADLPELAFEPEYEIRVSTVMDEYRAIVRALRRERFGVRLVNLRDDIEKLERLLRRNPPDVVFNLVEYLHEDPEFEPHVAALFELHHVAYTGSAPFALSVCRKKDLIKQLFVAHGVPTPRFRLFVQPRLPKRLGLRFPVIVKPALEDASSGVERESVVYDPAQLGARLEYILHEFGIPVLVEEFIDGPELHVSIFGNDPPQVLPPIEWDFSELPADHPPIISFAAKWNPLSEVFHRVRSFCPPRLPRRTLRKVEQVALRAYHVSGCRDYARLDIRVSRKGQAFVLEVNPNPDLTEGVSFMESAEVGGHTFSGTLRRLVEFALERRSALAATRARLRRRGPAGPASPEAVAVTLEEASAGPVTPARGTARAKQHEPA